MLKSAPHGKPSAGTRLFRYLVGFGAIVGALLFLWIFVLGPVIGLAFGWLELPGRHGDLTLHGPWARGVSLSIIAVDVVLYLRWRAWSRRGAASSSARR